VSMMARIAMHVDPRLDGVGAPLTQARVRVHLKDGRLLEATANGARGYPEQPADEDELAAKFLSCAARAIPRAQAELALGLARRLETLADVRDLTRALALTM